MDNIQAREFLKKSHGFGTFVPKAVLFDMDGVLYDSMPFHARAWHDSMAAFGLEMSGRDAYLNEGMRGVETIMQLGAAQHRHIDLQTAQEMYKVKSAHFASYGQAPVMPGVKELMQSLHDDGLIIGIVTGSGQDSLLHALLKDFEGLVVRERMVTSYDVTIGKPHPMPYLKGLEKVGVSAGEAAVIENAPLGVRAARAAGIFTIAVNTGILNDEDLLAEGPDLLFHDMGEVLTAWRHSPDDDQPVKRI